MPKKNSIIYFTKYSEKGASSRYRSYQYRNKLNKEFNLLFYPLFYENYTDDLNKKRSKNKLLILRGYLLRVFQVLSLLRTKKIVFIEYELLPYFPPLLELLLYKSGVKMVFDYDDAIFHNYDMHPNKLIRFLYQNKIKTIIKYASHVITGSPYLTSYVNLHTKRISEIPTSINLSLYDYKLDNILKKKIFVIAWIGSSTTSMNLLNLKDVFVKLFHIDSSIKLKLMGFDKSLVGEFRVPNIEFCDWSPQAELSLLKEMDLGIMPLEDNPFNRGKCGFKLIQYMGMGKPTISSPLPANIKINRDNSNLFAENNHEWFSSILNVRNNPDYFRMIGYRNIAIVEKYYSVETNYNEYVKIFKELQYVRN